MLESRLQRIESNYRIVDVILRVAIGSGIIGRTLLGSERFEALKRFRVRLRSDKLVKTAIALWEDMSLLDPTHFSARRRGGG